MNIPVDVRTDSSIFKAVIADPNYFAFEVSYQLPPYSPETVRAASLFGPDSANVRNYPQPTVPAKGGMSTVKTADEFNGGAAPTADQVDKHPGIDLGDDDS